MQMTLKISIQDLSGTEEQSIMNIVNSRIAGLFDENVSNQEVFIVVNYEQDWDSKIENL